MIINKTPHSPLPNFKILKCTLIEKNWLTPTIVRSRFSNQYLAEESHAGQFVNIKVSDGSVPLLRRPFSIHRINRIEHWFEILFQVIGKGTRLLADCEIGERLDVLGPLGNGFTMLENCNRAILIAGGLGIAPLLLLGQQLKNADIPATLYYGNKTNQNFCCLENFESLDVPYFLATEDGSSGFKGKVTELFLESQAKSLGSNSIIYACGPNPMLQKIKEIANQLQLPCQVSLETMMACGFGACLGCVINSTSPAEPYKYVCKDGPVFDANEINLSE